MSSSLNWTDRHYGIRLCADTLCFHGWKAELEVLKEQTCHDSPVCSKVLAWTFTTTATSLEWPRKDGCLCDSDDGWTIVTFISGTSLFIPKLTFDRAPSQHGQIWLTLNHRGKIETCPLSSGKGPRIFQQMCLLFQQRSNSNEQQKEGAGGGQKVPSPWISWNKTKQIHYSMAVDMLSRRSRSKNKSILLITHY